MVNAKNRWTLSLPAPTDVIAQIFPSPVVEIS